VHIAFVSQPRDSVAGAGPQRSSVATVLWELATQLATSHRVTIVAPHFTGQARDETTPEGIRIVRVPGVRRGINRGSEFVRAVIGGGQPHFFRNSYFREFGRAAAAFLADDAPDVAHVMVHPQFGEPIRNAVPDARLVLHLHDALLVHLDPDIARHRLAPFDSVLGVSDWVASTIRDRVTRRPGTVRTLYNGVNADQFAPIGNTHGSTTGQRILYVGRVSPEKGVADLIAAFGELALERPGLQLDLVGPVALLPYSIIRLLEQDPTIRRLTPYYGTDLVSRFRKQIAGARSSFRAALEASVPAGLEHRVQFHGPVPHDELPALYGRARVFAFPSLWQEPFGLPILEAMAMNLPVVASRSGGIPEIVTAGETGLLCDRGDVSELAGALRRVLDDPDLAERLGKAGADRARDQFSWKAAGERLADIYTDLR